MRLPRPGHIVLVALLAFMALAWLALAPLSAEKRFARNYSRLVNKGANTPENLRELFRQGLDTMATSSLLALVEKNSFCHADAHEMGKLVYSRAGANLALAFETCGKHCLDGCFHGTLMEAFRDADQNSDEMAHISTAGFQTKASEICKASANIQQPEECSHAIGHGLLVSTADMHRSLKLCQTFVTPGLRYYCSTGVFMQRDIDHGEEDAASDNYTYPCDKFAGQYDVPCWRYKVRQLFIKFQTSTNHVGSSTSNMRAIKKVKEICRALPDKARLGCWHGLGNGLFAEIIEKPEYLRQLCVMNDNSEYERLACIDGAMENVSLIARGKARTACALLNDPRLAAFCSSIHGKDDSLTRATLPLYY